MSHDVAHREVDIVRGKSGWPGGRASDSELMSLSRAGVTELCP